MGVRLGLFDADPGVRPAVPPVRRVRRGVGADPRRRAAAVPRATHAPDRGPHEAIGVRPQGADRGARARARAPELDRELRAEPDLPRRRRRPGSAVSPPTRRSSARSATSRTRRAASSSGSGTSRTASGPRPATASSRRSAPARPPSPRAAGCSATAARSTSPGRARSLPKIESGPVWLIAGTDITDRKRHEAEVRRSRSRIVAAADDARRRHRAQPARRRAATADRAAACACAARNVARSHPTLPSTARSPELAAAVKELRELAQGIHPSALSERGLAAALRIVASARRSRVELDVTTTPLETNISVAAYYIVSEALEQRREVRRGDPRRGPRARDRARADRRRRGRRQGRRRPDGRHRAGGLADRVAAFDGRLEIDSPAGGGTRLRAELPFF